LIHFYKRDIKTRDMRRFLARPATLHLRRDVLSGHERRRT